MKTTAAWMMGLAGLALAAQGALAQTQAPAPEAATGRTARALGQSTQHMVAAANPLAAEAGGRSCGPAAAPRMRRSRCSSCSTSSNRKARASAAGPSWSITTPARAP